MFEIDVLIVAETATGIPFGGMLGRPRALIIAPPLPTRQAPPVNGRGFFFGRLPSAGFTKEGQTVTQNIYDNELCFSGVIANCRAPSKVSTERRMAGASRDAAGDGCGLQGGDLGLRLRLVLPLGPRSRGAAQVLGLDVSENMLARARATLPSHLRRSSMSAPTWSCLALPAVGRSIWSTVPSPCTTWKT